MAPYGLDLQYLHYLAHYADGDWDHAQEIADGFAVRVTSVAEARLSAMALFIDVARGSPAVADRRTWLEPYLADGPVDRVHRPGPVRRGRATGPVTWQGAVAQAAGDGAAAMACG